MLEHGYIQIYTGDGKGKTTASLGLALRALGHGWKVMIIQFTKGDSGTTYGEIASAGKFLENLELEHEGTVHHVRTLDLSAGGMKLKTTENINIEYEYNVTIRLNDEIEVHCKYQLIRVEKCDDGTYTISGRFTQLSNVDKMSLVHFCMKKSMENDNK